MSCMLPTDPEEKLEQKLQTKKTQSLELELEGLGLEMPQPSVSGMDPPFGEAFRNHMFPEQTLMSTDLLANSSDPDFMYELDREMEYQQSSRDNPLSIEDCKDIENLESFTDILDTESSFPANWEQWDTYCEDLTKYTKLTSCDIWGTKEVDYLGLDDFSSPYQDEEVISKTPTLAQLNSEDSQSVADPLCYPDLLFSVKQTQLTSLPAKKITTRAAAPVCSSKTPQAETPLSECAQKAAKSNSSTQIMVKTNVYSNEKVNIHVECKDYVKKAKVKINPVPQSRSAVNQANADAAKENTCYCGAVAKKQERKGSDSLPSHNAPVLPFKETQALLLTPPQETPVLITEESSLSASTSVSDPSQKKEEHNYSLFVTDGLGEQAGKADLEEEEEEEDDEEVEDEDHDEGFGSEHELSENDEEEEDYEDDKDDDISDTFSEPGYENDSVEDLKEMTAISCRKRGKRRYFWEYSEQLTPSQQERMLRPSEWNRDTLPSNMYQKNGLHHGKYAVKKSRRTDVEDLTPNPKKLLQIGNELRKLNKVISDLTPVSELPLTARPRSRKEKNKLASRACRLKKKAQYEANKVKLWGLNTEYDNLLFVINSIKQEIVNRVQSPRDDRGTNMEQKLDVLIKDTLGPPVAGQTSEFVNQVLEKTAEGDPTGGLVGLRIPTSKV
ncbi:CREB3 regulatory factor [Hemicordylus capensis]|uniref:CREB3 regulatory factor n=1 Tax=Hemicordylus capensis TaxID=884348 RepID=UPI00230347BD|nr:CREB3 regulatory factor [Hemicordylus capensis]XP_053148127.1 CREB3 regulatory factor [Hemicordylus capensis]XP_053148128.1 CREB3 regulatory factor [Hemicordylus capensis]XP_053148130.1 CREB3 regulatory factor [Hemicordylus capensis]